ncbi:hypothetical protein D9M68_1004720 [compost metagenome]
MVTSPADTVVSTTTLRPLISFTRPRITSSPVRGVGFKKSTCNEPVTKRNAGSESMSRPSCRYIAAAAVPVLWQSISEAIRPP